MGPAPLFARLGEFMKLCKGVGFYDKQHQAIVIDGMTCPLCYVLQEVARLEEEAMALRAKLLKIERSGK